MASLQDSAINYLVKTRGGTWKVDAIDVVTVENQDTYAFGANLNIPACAAVAKVAKKGATNDDGTVDLMPQIGWQVLLASSGLEVQAIVWLDTTNQMIWDANDCAGLFGHVPMPWWILALLGAGAMLLLWPRKKK